MNPESEEKQKQKPSLRRRLWRIFLAIVLLAFLIPALYLGGRYVYNYSMYLMHLQRWNEQDLDYKVVPYHCDYYPNLDLEHQELCNLFASPTEVDAVFEEVLRCINTFFCEVRYDGRYNYPTYIGFERTTGHIRVEHSADFPQVGNE